jgi:hypothetical protein
LQLYGASSTKLCALEEQKESLPCKKSCNLSADFPQQMFDKPAQYDSFETVKL